MGFLDYLRIAFWNTVTVFLTIAGLVGVALDMSGLGREMTLLRRAGRTIWILALVAAGICGPYVAWRDISVDRNEIARRRDEIQETSRQLASRIEWLEAELSKIRLDLRPLVDLSIQRFKNGNYLNFRHNGDVVTTEVQLKITNLGKSVARGVRLV